MTGSPERTPLYEEHQKLGARLVPFAGFLMPIQYRGITEEHVAVRTRAGLFDVSHMGELVVRDDNAVDLVNRLVTNDVARIVDGQALYTCCCNEAGKILDDLIIYRRGPKDVLVVCNASNREKITTHFRAHVPAGSLSDESDETALIALQGPKAVGMLGAIGVRFDAETPPKPFRFVQASVAGRPATVARTGYTGEDGVEIFSASGDASAIWRALVQAGAEPAGLGARDTLRLEARLSLYGNDIDEACDPLEAGLGWTVKLDKPEFLGKAALLKIKEAGSRRQLVEFEMTGRGIARQGYPLLDQGGAPLGVCTSGSPSPTLGKNIGLGYMPAGQCGVGTRFLVDCRAKHVEAQVVETPFYKRPKAS